MSAYPQEPGFKVSGTSQEAAEAIGAKGRAETLNAKTLASIRRSPKCPEEVAAELGEDILSIRPRFTQLKERGQIVKTVARRKSASGCSVTVWAAVPDQRGAA